MGGAEDGTTPGGENVNRTSDDASTNEQDKDRMSNKKRRALLDIKKKNPTNFKGETSEMQGHVFQTFAESGSRRQFKKTTEALERYINKKLNCHF